MYSTKVIGERIRRLRKKKAWSQARLAEEIGVSENFIGYLERAEKSGTLETLEKLAIALDTSLSELLFMSEKLGKNENPEILIEIVDKLSDRSIEIQKAALLTVDALLSVDPQK
ncbi:helix-turn-helix domain-containing protein [Bacillus sp. PS06]|uniref:helix-turn-helix domain-containing protein n=1 Tax=Bacillus sp. PS06 TaxID=2764176 RepID=UPI00178490A9|nr:helix-turn-helix transcriptional regulator [Bacillus sp. PS06]MBD8069384.1 helix-turn-helix transcriptional regulator [Bacillus sp. PS06]